MREDVRSTWLITLYVIVGAVVSNALGLSMASTECDDVSLLLNSDGGYETAYAWNYGGVAVPYYGAFAEHFEASGQICSIVLDVTGSGSQNFSFTDFYIWTDQSGTPGQVACLKAGVNIGSVPIFPNIRRVEEPIDGCCATEGFWVGYWPDNPGAATYFYIGADLGPELGNAMTNIAPNLPYPSGWQSVDVAWGPTRAVGIGVRVVPCEPTPTSASSWGAIKSLFKY